MNIFKIMSSGDGRILEPCISSFLAYLLDPKEDHGLSSILLWHIIEHFKEKDKTFFSMLKTPDSIKSVNIETEVKVFLDNGNSKDIDIVVEIKNSLKSAEPLYVLCIENKIKDGSIQKNQLREEYEGIKKVYADNSVQPEIYFCFITLKDSKGAVEEFNNLQDCDKKLHLLWKKQETKCETESQLMSMQVELLRILDLERNGEIDPISSDVSFLLKSFVLFIKSEFKSKLKEKEDKQKLDYGKGGAIDYFRDVAKELAFKKDYTRKDVLAKVRQKIKEKTGIDANTSTLYRQMCVSIVNERNRGYNDVTPENCADKNLFYYPNEKNKGVVRKYNTDDPELNAVRIYTNKDVKKSSK